MELTEHAGRRMRRGRTVNLKLRFANFRTITRAKTLHAAADVAQESWHGVDVLTQVRLKADQGILRLGLGVSRFAGDRFVQRTLFDENGPNKQQKLDAVMDAVREKFGFQSLSCGSGLKHQARHRTDPNTEDGDET